MEINGSFQEGYVPCRDILLVYNAKMRQGDPTTI